MKELIIVSLCLETTGVAIALSGGNWFAAAGWFSALLHSVLLYMKENKKQ